MSSIQEPHLHLEVGHILFLVSGLRDSEKTQRGEKSGGDECGPDDSTTLSSSDIFS
jgi:hypothetical protein